MKISIITISYNDELGLQKTINSVSSQTYTDIEHIIIDGGTENFDSKLIYDLKKYPGPIISEKDMGMYDAMNKGLGYSTGSYVGILNSGDIYSNPEIVQKYVDFIKIKNNPDAIYSNIKFTNEKKIMRQWNPGSFNKLKFLLGWMLPHPSIYVRNDLIMNCENFDLDFSIAADYEWMLRNFFFLNFKPLKLEICSVIMEAGGISNKNFKSIALSNFEVLRAWKKHSWFIPFWIFILKPISKIFQIVR